MTEEQQAETPKMRAGLPLADRQRLRAAILEERLARARRDAAETCLSVRCLMHLPHRSPTLSYDQQRLEHTRCQGESAGGGCLCPWHDAEIEPIPETPSAQEGL